MSSLVASSLLKAFPLYALAATGETAAQASPLDRAMAHFEDSDWEHAFEDLVPLADQGDPTAARIALMMHDNGPRLFECSFAASDDQRSRWVRLASSFSKQRLAAPRISDRGAKAPD